jgi:cytidylate kinase
MSARRLKRITIAIDGYSGCGKSTTAREVSSILGYRYIDSGAMYRAVTLYFLEHHVAVTNPREVNKALSEIRITFQVNAHGTSDTFLNGVNVESSIREMRVSEFVSRVSELKVVRHAMVEQQRRMGKTKGIVMDGRDIGTVVFPDAELKLFLTAEIMVRAFRRQKEMLERDQMVDLDEIIANLEKRDLIDSQRAESPLRKADGAIELDTTFITIDEQVDAVLAHALGKIISAR